MWLYGGLVLISAEWVPMLLRVDSDNIANDYALWGLILNPTLWYSIPTTTGIHYDPRGIENGSGRFRF